MPELYWGAESSEKFLAKQPSEGAMAKDTRVTFDSEATGPPAKSTSGKSRRGTERQISYEDAENCVNEMSESFPALSNRYHRFMRQVSGSFNSKTIKIGLILSILLNLLLGIPFGVFLGMWLTQKNDIPFFPTSNSFSSSSSSSSSSSLSPSSSSLHSHHQQQQSSSSQHQQGYGQPIMVEACFPCSDVDQSVTEVKIRSRNNMCCGDGKQPDSIGGNTHCLLANDYLTKKFEEVLSKCRQPPGHSTRSANPADDLPTAAHLTLDMERTQKNVDAGKTTMVWRSSDKYNGTFPHSGIRYENGSIVILKAATYHVYSTMGFFRPVETKDRHRKHNFNDQAETGEKVVHSVSMESKIPTGRSRRFLSMLDGGVTMREGDTKSSTLMGTFRLKAGDRLFVYVSKPSYINRSGEEVANVFGLFEL